MTLSITASVSAGVPPRVLLTVTSSPSVTNVLRVWRVTADGSRTRVLTAGRALLNGSWMGFDFHAPFNTTVTYIAETGTQADSAPSGVVFIPSDRFWLLHPANPEWSVPVGTVLGVGAKKLADQSQSFKILGRSSPVVVWNYPRASETGDFRFLIEDAQEEMRVRALFEDGGPIFMNSHRAEVLSPKWVQPGDISIEPPGGYYQTPLREVSFSWSTCAAPDVDVEPVWTYADLVAAFPSATYADITATWASYGDMSIDRRA